MNGVQLPFHGNQANKNAADHSIPPQRIAGSRLRRAPFIVVFIVVLLVAAAVVAAVVTAAVVLLAAVVAVVAVVVVAMRGMSMVA